MSGTKYDITELYDVLRERRDCAYVCADVKRLMWVNETFGNKGGDAVILETMLPGDDPETAFRAAALSKQELKCPVAAPFGQLLTQAAQGITSAHLLVKRSRFRKQKKLFKFSIFDHRTCI